MHLYKTRYKIRRADGQEETWDVLFEAQTMNVDEAKKEADKHIRAKHDSARFHFGDTLHVPLPHHSGPSIRKI